MDLKLLARLRSLHKYIDIIIWHNEQKCKNRGNQYGQNLADERNHAQQNYADQIDKKKIGQKKRPFSEESQTIQDPVPACSGFQ